MVALSLSSCSAKCMTEDETVQETIPMGKAQECDHQDTPSRQIYCVNRGTSLKLSELPLICWGEKVDVKAQDVGDVPMLMVETALKSLDERDKGRGNNCPVRRGALHCYVSLNSWCC